MPHELSEARLSDHESRCQAIYKKAYVIRLLEEPQLPAQLEKAALSMGGYEPTLTMDPMGAGIGGLAGAGAGALGGMGARALNTGITDAQIQQLMAAGGGLGALGGGFSRETSPEMEEELVRRQAMEEAKRFADQYAGQMSSVQDLG